MDNTKRPNHRPNKPLKITASESTTLNDEYYTIYELAEILKVHHNTIRRAIKRGDIKAFKIGTEWRINKKDFIVNGDDTK